MAVKRKVFLNGSFVDAGKARLSVMDPGFLYGWGIFETIRIYGGQPFLLEDHIGRLFSSARMIGLRPAYGRFALYRAVMKTVRLNRTVEGVLRITLWKGAELKTNICAWVRDKNVPGSYRRGWQAAILLPRKDPSSILSGLKSSCYLDHLFERRRVRSKGCEEGIFLSSRGKVAEGTATNIFIVKQGLLLTPPLKEGILPGITRGAVLRLASLLGFKTAEKEIGPADLKKADEAFLTNSLIEVMPLVRVDGSKIGSGLPGRMTMVIHAAYRSMIYHRCSYAAYERYKYHTGSPYGKKDKG